MFRLSVALLSIIIIGNFGLFGVAAAANSENPFAPSQSSGENKTPEQYWQETGLTIDFVGQKIQSECAKSEKNYLACVQGVNVAASFLTPAAAFATATEALKSPAQFGAVVKNYGPYNLYVLKKQPTLTSPRDYWSREKGLRAAQRESATAAYASSKNLQFSNILNQLKGILIKGELAQSEGFIAASIYNTYLASAVDPHTHIDPIAQVSDEGKSTDASYAGIGSTLETFDGQTMIKSPMAGSPSLEAGLKAKDIIVTIDGAPIQDLPLSQVVKKLKGPEGTSVKVGVLRKGQTLAVTVIRRKIQIKNVEASLLNDSGTPYGYIKLANFMENKACLTVANDVLVLKKMGAKGLVLDLRDDGGGLLSQAVCIGSIFVGKKVILSVKALNGGRSNTFVGQNDAITDLPMVTLINSGSASASEILAGALQDYKRSWMAGNRSFGKASVQSPSDFTPSILIFNTIQRFYQPSGRTNQVVGIMPDFNIDPVPNATEDDKFALREEDYYTNALPAQSQPWSEQRPAEVAKIQSCLKASGLADKVYQARSGDALAPDYQLITSQVILNCQNP